MKIKMLFPITLAAAMIFLLPIKAQSQLSVALSDNLVVLSNQERSGQLELVNSGSDPTEFRLTVESDMVGADVDGRTVIRWSPARALVSPHRTLPVRIAARPPHDLPPGEYVLRAGVTAAVQTPPSLTGPRMSDEEVAGVAVVIPIVPTLPITVYYRHDIPNPMIEAEALVPMPDDTHYVGYFQVRKSDPKYSFVGYIAVVDAMTGQVVNQGRLHLLPGVESGQVRIPHSTASMSASGQYCIRIWDHWPARGVPGKEVCDAL
ncbi:hypothetical protein CKO35_17320 [Ectothiorhodospira shaposhnikovii]|uniref:hypothetical protein n=1 Tax=Ectothiorhodospira shaposhnikovii TaxID=1054 RepID=UPI001908694D|nr:hypothetical protein [Ectothiorhodospira shaposhnikovii]MBK1675001.1 hypothetical protein [Ectothiorhodospira shaposhnikovii]